MYYFKINDLIRELINVIPDVIEKRIFIGCKPHCKSQIIALDELEMLKKLLKEYKIKDINNEEFKELKNSTKSAYFMKTHICEGNDNLKSSSYDNDDSYNTINSVNYNIINDQDNTKDSIKKRNKKDLFDTEIDYDYQFKLQKELNDNNKNAFQVRESNIGYGISMLTSFFLIVMGIYYLCDLVLKLSRETTLKITIVTTIVVVIAEAFLLLIRLDRDDKKNFNRANLNKNSVAYKFNLEYKNKVDKELERRNTVKQKKD